MQKKPQKSPIEQPDVTEKVVDDKARQTRRGLIKAGLIGLPVVITLKSKPAWGVTGQDTPSVEASLTHQSHAMQNQDDF
jgi:hypothetical protein